LLIKECFVWSFTKRVMPYQFTINFLWLTFKFNPKIKFNDMSQTISFEIESCFWRNQKFVVNNCLRHGPH
jgi:hypothetical protein